MLRTYATPTAMSEALENLRLIPQRAKEDEVFHKKRLNYGIHRCGNIHEEDEKMTFNIGGPPQKSRTIVARFPEG